MRPGLAAANRPSAGPICIRCPPVAGTLYGRAQPGRLVAPYRGDIGAKARPTGRRPGSRRLAPMSRSDETRLARETGPALYELAAARRPACANGPGQGPFAASQPARKRRAQRVGSRRCRQTNPALGGDKERRVRGRKGPQRSARSVVTCGSPVPGPESSTCGNRPAHRSDDGLRGMQASELPDNEEQAEHPGPHRVPEVLPMVRAPHAAQGNPVAATRRSGVSSKGRSSTGRAPVSKTGGWGFESLRPCSPRRMMMS